MFCTYILYICYTKRIPVDIYIGMTYSWTDFFAKKCKNTKIFPTQNFLTKYILYMCILPMTYQYIKQAVQSCNCAIRTRKPFLLVLPPRNVKEEGESVHRHLPAKAALERVLEAVVAHVNAVHHRVLEGDAAEFAGGSVGGLAQDGTGRLLRR